MAALHLPLLRRTTCPHCWATFPPEEILWESAHSDLLGDPRLGPMQQLRFLPTRFNLEGNALDARGLVCTKLACPQCHLSVPRSLLEIEPLFVSILGTPACGKSYFLATMTWELRRLLRQAFGLMFTDADVVSNRHLNDYEAALFMHPRKEQYVAVADLIRKTELQGELYDTVMHGDQAVSYPRPFLFMLQPVEAHPFYQRSQEVARILCLYDNAGEHFLAGQDSAANPVTRHLAHSRFLLFLFDPTQDRQFRHWCQQQGLNAPSLSMGRISRQEAVLNEAANRVRQLSGMSLDAKHERPLIVVVTKADAWLPLLGENGLLPDPWKPVGNSCSLQAEVIEKRSEVLRNLLAQVCPELVSAAEGFARNVTYIPVSALGSAPLTDSSRQSLLMRPGDIRPYWVVVPMLYGLSRFLPGLIPVLRKKAAATAGSTARMSVAR
jgi:hypothetical protein